MNSFGSQMFAQLRRGDKAVELQNGIFRDEPLFSLAGEFRLGPIFGWNEQHLVRCNLDLAQKLDAALSQAAEVGPISLPNPQRVRRLLIESGSVYSLSLAEPRWREADGGAMCVYRHAGSNTRPWRPVVLATQQQLAALAALLLDGAAVDLDSAPLLGPHRYGASLVVGLNPITIHGLNLSADAEVEFDAEFCPKSILARTQVLARRIVSQAELDSVKEVA